MDGSYKCPKSKTTVRFDDEVTTATQDNSNINQLWQGYNKDTGKTIINGEEHDLELTVGKGVQRVQVMEKVGHGRKYRWCKGDWKKMYATFATSGVIDDQTATLIEAVYDKVVDQSDVKLPVFVHMDTNVNGYLNAVTLLERGIDVCLVLGDEKCLKKYEITKMGMMSETDTNRLDEMIEDNDKLDMKGRTCNGTYTNADQHISFKYPCLITNMHDEVEVKIASLQVVSLQAEEEEVSA